MDYGNPCNVVADPYIGRCHYYAAYEILEHFYGDLKVINQYVQSNIHHNIMDSVFMLSFFFINCLIKLLFILLATG